MAVFTAIGAAIFGAGTFLAGLTAAGLQIATGLVVSALTRGASSGEVQPPKFGVQGQLQGGDEVPRSINFGWNCTAGSLAWHHTFGSGGTMSVRVIALGDLPIRELLYPIVDGIDCTLLKGQVHADYGWPVEQYRKGGVDHLWIKFYDGTQTAADPFLVSTFAEDPDRPYQASRVGRGNPYVIVFARAPERNDEGDKPLFQGIPAFKFVTNGVRLYNLALDSSMGGAGPHRWNDPSTWGGVGDFNPIVQLYNALRGIRFQGQWLYGMQGTTAARLPAANWIAGILAAQAAIAGPAGMEPTYRAGGEVQVGAQVATPVEAWLTAANARLAEDGGAYTIHVGPPGSPVMAFTDDEILSTEEQSFSPFLSLSDTVNGIDANYPNPAEGWNSKKAPPLLRPDLEPLAGNRRLMASVSLDLVPYPGQVQRLMLWALNEALRARRHTFVLGPEFRVLELGDTVRWTSTRNGYVDKLFRVDGLIKKSNLDVIVDLTEVDPADYDWDQEADYTPVIDGPLQLVGPKPMPMQGWQVFPATIIDELGRARRPSIEVWAASGIPSVDRVRVQVRVGDEDGPLIFDNDGQPYGDPWRWVLQGQFPADTLVAVRGILVGPPAAQWSGWFQVRTPDVKLSALDVTYGDFDLDGLGDQVDGFFDWMGGSIRDLYEKAQEQDLLGADQELANAMQFDELRRSLSVVSGDLSASFEETITVTLLPMQGRLVAIADALTELSAGDGDDVSTARFRMTAQTGETGGVTIGAQGRTGSEGSWRDAGYFLYVPNDEEVPSRFTVVADQFVVTATVGASVFQPFVFEGGNLRVSNAFIANLTAANIEVGSLTADLLEAGTITSDKINVAELVASDAFLENLVVGSANIGTAQIGELQLANGAVTAVYRNLITSDTTVTNSNINTISIPNTDFPCTVVFVAQLTPPGTGGTEVDYVLETTGGVELARARMRSEDGNPAYGTLRLTYVGYGIVPPNATSYRVRSTGATTTQTIKYLNFTVTHPKR